MPADPAPSAEPRPQNLPKPAAFRLLPSLPPPSPSTGPTPTNSLGATPPPASESVVQYVEAPVALTSV